MTTAAQNFTGPGITHRGGDTGARSEPGPAGKSSMETPRRLWIVLGVMVLTLLGTGAMCASTLAARQSAENRAVNSAALLANVDELYHSLADADATAATALLAGQVPPARFTDQYAKDVTQATNALAQASRDLAGDDGASKQLGAVASQLPAYTGLIATAQANNRLGYPVAGAYLREASSLLRGPMLREVAMVAQDESAAQTSAQNDVASAPVLLIVVVLIALIVLFFAGRSLSRTTRRTVNLGAAVGVLIAFVLVVWSLAATLGAAGASHRAQTDFTVFSANLSDRNQIALAQSYQSLTLIDRGEDGGTDDAGRKAALRQVSDQSGDKTAQNLLAAMKGRMSSVANDVTQGDLHHAIDLDVGQGDAANASTVTAAASSLDAELAARYKTDHSAYVSDSGSAGSALGGGLWIGVILGVLAAAAAAYGVNRRLAEYR
ncbi:MAG: hypothetical protein ACRDVE_04995 [Actinocrinis sp.]